MIKKYSLAMMLPAFLCWPASAQDAKAIVASAAKAMGVEDLWNLGSYSYSGAGASFQFGEARTPSAPWPKSMLSRYYRAIDFDAGGSLEILNRRPDSLPETRRIPFVEPYGQVGKQFEIWMTPLGFLKRAMDSGAIVKIRTVAGKQFNVVSFTSDKKYTIEGYFDAGNLLERVETRIDNPVLGDMPVESVYSDYKDFQHGLTFPSRIVQSQGGFPVLDLTIKDAARNVIAPALEAMVFFYEGVGAPRYHGAFDGPPPPISVDETRLAAGVHSLTGGTHHSVVVEFNDYLVVIEAPLDPAHSRAVIADLKETFGSKPVRYVVNTHAHLDAAGGLRAYAVEGATVITQELNKPYYEKVFAQPRTIDPDGPSPAKLSQTQKRAQIEGVAEKRILTDGTHVIELYHVQNEHADGMLIAYLPKEKIVVESGLYTARDPEIVINQNGEVSSLPKPPVSPDAASLVSSLNRLKLDYRMVVGLEGRPAQKAEFLEDVNRGAGTSAARPASE